MAGGTVSVSVSLGFFFLFVVSVPFGLFILRPFLRATLPAAKSNLQKFFHQKSAVSINILKIAGTAIAKHIDRTHRHTQAQGDRRRLLLLVASCAAAAASLPGLLHSPAAAYDLWMHVLIYAMCPPGLVPARPPPPTFPPLPTPASVVLLAPKIMLQYFCSAWETLCIVGSSTRTANKRQTC